MKKRILISLIVISQTFFLKAQNEGDSIFNSNQIHEVYFTFSQPNYWDSLTYYYTIDTVYLKGNMEFNGVTYNDVGVKFKGNSSYNNPSDKKSFKIDMNEFVSGQKVDGLKKFNLNNGFKDPTFLREKIALDFCKDHGLAAPRCSFAKVYINGTYWGLYTIVEEIDNGTFLKKQYNNKDGNMFKGDPSGDLRWYGSSPSLYYPKYELKTNETANDWTDLVSFINKINNSGSYFYDSLETILKTSSFIKHWAALNLFVNLDSYIGSGHNYFVYHDTLSDKFEWLTWDSNESFGNFQMGMTLTQLKNLSMYWVSSPSANRPLVQKMLANTIYKDELTTTFCNWIEYDFSNAALDSKIDSLANAIRNAVYADTKKFYSNAQFESNLTSDINVTGSPGLNTIMGLKNFITSRRNAIVAELATQGCVIGVSEVENNSKFNFYPNPSKDYIVVDVQGERNTITILNILGDVVYENTINHYNSRVNISHLNTGIYLLKVNHGVAQKLEIIK
jgi:spore coat protein H